MFHYLGVAVALAKETSRSLGLFWITLVRQRWHSQLSGK